MKKILFILGIGVMACLSACNDDDDENNAWEEYRAWYEENVAWYNNQKNIVDSETGLPFYEKVVPAWSSEQSIYMHWFNDRSETAGNLVPDLTSTVGTYYKAYLIDGTLVDESDNLSNKLLVSEVTGLIKGWQIALQNMHVGDSVQIIMPYYLGYGSSGAGKILPYSVLRFNMRLVDIPNYETKP